MVSVRVPGVALRLTVIVSVDVPGLLAGFGLKVAVVRGGNPDTLRLTEALPATWPMVTVYWPLEARLTISVDGDADMVKSGVGALIRSDRFVE